MDNSASSPNPSPNNNAGKLFDRLSTIAMARTGGLIKKFINDSGLSPDNKHHGGCVTDVIGKLSNNLVESSMQYGSTDSSGGGLKSAKSLEGCNCSPIEGSRKRPPSVGSISSSSSSSSASQNRRCKNLKKAMNTSSESDTSLDLGEQSEKCGAMGGRRRSTSQSIQEQEVTTTTTTTAYGTIGRSSGRDQAKMRRECSSGSLDSKESSHVPRCPKPPAPLEKTLSSPTPAPGLSYIDKVVMEIIETEKSYVKDLKDIIRGYYIPISKNPGMAREDLHALFGNIKSIYKFNRKFLACLSKCELDPVQVASYFVNHSDGFKIYTLYCTNYPRSLDTLVKYSKDPVYSAAFERSQRSLKHPLPLQTYLFKPVQRILKYHLLLKNIVSHHDEKLHGHDVINKALDCMVDVATHINEMKRSQEQYLRMQEIQRSLQGVGGIELGTFGELVIEDKLGLCGSKDIHQVFLFKKGLLIAKKRKDNGLLVKAAILCSNLMLVESVSREPLSFHVIPFDSPKMQYTLQAANLQQKRSWCQEIKKLILDSFKVQVPEKARELLMLQGSSQQFQDGFVSRKHTAPEYLERRRMRRRSVSSLGGIQRNLAENRAGSNENLASSEASPIVEGRNQEDKIRHPRLARTDCVRRHSTKNKERRSQSLESVRNLDFDDNKNPPTIEIEENSEEDDKPAAMVENDFRLGPAVSRAVSFRKAVKLHRVDSRLVGRKPRVSRRDQTPMFRDSSSEDSSCEVEKSKATEILPLDELYSSWLEEGHAECPPLFRLISETYSACSSGKESNVGLSDVNQEDVSNLSDFSFPNQAEDDECRSFKLNVSDKQNVSSLLFENADVMSFSTPVLQRMLADTVVAPVMPSSAENLDNEKVARKISVSEMVQNLNLYGKVETNELQNVSVQRNVVSDFGLLNLSIQNKLNVIEKCETDTKGSSLTPRNSIVKQNKALFESLEKPSDVKRVSSVRTVPSCRENVEASNAGEVLNMFSSDGLSSRSQDVAAAQESLKSFTRKMEAADTRRRSSLPCLVVTSPLATRRGALSPSLSQGCLTDSPPINDAEMVEMLISSEQKRAGGDAEKPADVSEGETKCNSGGIVGLIELLASCLDWTQDFGSNPDQPNSENDSRNETSGDLISWGTESEMTCSSGDDDGANRPRIRVHHTCSDAPEELDTTGRPVSCMGIDCRSLLDIPDCPLLRSMDATDGCSLRSLDKNGRYVFRLARAYSNRLKRLNDVTTAALKGSRPVVAKHSEESGKKQEGDSNDGTRSQCTSVSENCDHGHCTDASNLHPSLGNSDLIPAHSDISQQENHSSRTGNREDFTTDRSRPESVNVEYSDDDKEGIVKRRIKLFQGRL